MGKTKSELTTQVLALRVLIIDSIKHKKKVVAPLFLL
jgi:hypothetical protein